MFRIVKIPPSMWKQYNTLARQRLRFFLVLSWRTPLHRAPVLHTWALAATVLARRDGTARRPQSVFS